MENDTLHRFGRRIRELRRARGYTQGALARAAGLNRNYIGGIERGERNVALRNIDTIARTLGMTLAELFTGL